MATDRPHGAVEGLSLSLSLSVSVLLCTGMAPWRFSKPPEKSTARPGDGYTNIAASARSPPARERV